MAVCLLTLAASACAGPQTGRSASLGQQVTLAIGQEVTFVGEPLRIAFVEVASDSRCPTGATCVWQGEASCRLTITFQDSKNSMIVTQSGLTDTPATATFNSYDIQFRVQPYPELAKQIKKSDYRLELTVRKKA